MHLFSIAYSDEIILGFIEVSSHPNHNKVQEKSIVDYENLKIVVRSNIAHDNSFIALDTNDIHATIFEEEIRNFSMKGFLYYPNDNSTIPFPLSSKSSIEKPRHCKKSRYDNGGSSNSIGTNY
ncbi:hypothetical protein CR513_09335, partial [Mucuna pruriens]